MSYTRKVIYISLGLLIAVTLISAIPGVASSSGRIDGLEVGLVAFSFSLFEAFVLIMVAFGILIVKPGGGSVDVPAPDDLLDATESRSKPLTPRRRAGAFFAAAGIVVLVGGSLCFGGISLGAI